MRLLIFCFVLFSASCKCKVIHNDIYINGFSSQLWKEDKLGCLGERKKMAQILEDSVRNIIGKNKSDLIKFLGYPDDCTYFQGDSDYIYFVSSGVQCFNKLWKEKRYIDAPQIAIILNVKGVIVGSTGVITP